MKAPNLKFLLKYEHLLKNFHYFRIKYTMLWFYQKTQILRERLQCPLLKTCYDERDMQILY